MTTQFSHVGYHQFPGKYGSFEVFHAKEYADGGLEADGWYWWACFPGCMPDSDPSGPYDTAEDAYVDAMME